MNIYIFAVHPCLGCNVHPWLSNSATVTE